MNNLKTIRTMRKPSFMKGASRVFDLYGKLDEYKKQDDADYQALKDSWENVGKTISKVTYNYGKEQQKQSISK